MSSKIKDMFSKLIELIKEKKKIFITGAVIIAGVILCYVVTMNILTPTLKLQSPDKKISSSYKEEIVIPATLSRLPDDSYPATSVSIKFDNSKLEFVDFTIGTMQTYNDYDETKGEEAKFKNPQWVYNVEIANQEGEINAMYLDTTAGKNAYSKNGFKRKEKDIPFKLVFKLKDSVIPNDKLIIDIEEAVFATVTGDTDKTTLSTKDNYGKLKALDATIKIK